MSSRLFFLTLRPPPRSTLFPYTTFFRSLHDVGLQVRRAGSSRAHATPGVAGARAARRPGRVDRPASDRKSTRLNSSHANISYAVFCLKKKNTHNTKEHRSLPHWPAGTTV